MLRTKQERRSPISPYLRDGLFLLISFGEPTAQPRERITGTLASVFSGTLARDQQGNIVTRYNGTSDKTEFADAVALRKPTTAFTLHTRVKLTTFAIGGAPAGAKRISTGGGGHSWGIEAWNDQFSAFMNNGTFININGGDGTVPTGLWMNAFVRWASGTPLTMDVFKDGGALQCPRVVSSNVSGTIAYDAGPLLFMWDQTNEAAGDMSLFAVWNRRLTDGELLQLAYDPLVLFRHTALLGSQFAASVDVTGNEVRNLLSRTRGRVTRRSG
jgi:hypothetical protein